MNTRAQYIQSIKDEMITVCDGTKLFPSVMIAQGCLESNNGNSELSLKYHNHFGIKPGVSWKGPTINLPTKEYIAGQPRMVPDYFRVYASLQECFADHIRLLQTVPCYRLAGLFDCTSPEGQCQTLRKAGYATDPGYPGKLISIINENFLKEYDPK